MDDRSIPGGDVEDGAAGLVPRDDGRLVAAVAAGSQEALGILYDRHATAVYRVALMVSGDRGIAEEVVQETFLALWNRADRFDPALGSISSWLYAIARNRTRDHLRHAGRRLPAVAFSSIVGDRPDSAATLEWIASSGDLLAAGRPDDGPETAIESAESRRAVVAALDVLTGPEREVILLAYRDGLSQSEIATALDWPLGTVKTRSRRALRRLRDALEGRPGEATIAVSEAPPVRPRESRRLAACCA